MNDRKKYQRELMAERRRKMREQGLREITVVVRDADVVKVREFVESLKND